MQNTVLINIKYNLQCNIQIMRINELYTFKIVLNIDEIQLTRNKQIKHTEDSIKSKNLQDQLD